MEVQTASNFTRVQKRILKALWALDALSGTVTSRDVKRKTRLEVRVINKTLYDMRDAVISAGGRGVNAEWKLRDCRAGNL